MLNVVCFQAEQLKAAQQLKLRQQQAAAVVAQGQVVSTTQAATAATSLQKTVAVNAQLITSIAQTQASQTAGQPARLQVVQVSHSPADHQYC